MKLTSELTERLYRHHKDYWQGYAQSLPDICHDCKEAADKIEELQRFINDMLGDHYIDYLDFYTNRCRELEEKLENINKMNLLSCYEKIA